MHKEQKDILEGEGTIGKRKSKLRQEIEEMLAEKGISIESRISIVNLDTKDAYYFDDYSQAMQFMRGKKGRWYLFTPGIQRK